jgi:hypothetical protein
LAHYLAGVPTVGTEAITVYTSSRPADPVLNDALVFLESRASTVLRGEEEVEQAALKALYTSTVREDLELVAGYLRDFGEPASAFGSYRRRNGSHAAWCVGELRALLERLALHRRVAAARYFIPWWRNRQMSALRDRHDFFLWLQNRAAGMPHSDVPVRAGLRLRRE